MAPATCHDRRGSVTGRLIWCRLSPTTSTVIGIGRLLLGSDEPQVRGTAPKGWCRPRNEGATLWLVVPLAVSRSFDRRAGRNSLWGRDSDYLTLTRSGRRDPRSHGPRP